MSSFYWTIAVVGAAGGIAGGASLALVFIGVLGLRDWMDARRAAKWRTS